MSCPDCQRAEADPLSGRYTANCRECIARSLAGSPAYFDSSRANAILPTYRAALQYFGGDTWKELHEQVGKWAKRIDLASTSIGTSGARLSKARA